MPRKNHIQFRKGTYSEWDAQNSTVLASGEPGFISDFNKLKIGDGSTQWSDLSAINDALTTLVYNGTSSTIPKMSVVYINGAQGDMPRVTLSIATGEMSSSKTYGITTGPISANGTGMVVVDGTLKNLNTLSEFSGVSPGTTLWLSSTVSGGITTTKPYAPNHMVALGSLIRVHSQQGVINVRIQNGFELEELHNVATTGVTDKQYLQYDNTSSLWIPTSSGDFSFLTVNDYIDVISSGISNPNFIRFNDTSTPSTPSIGSVSNGTRLLLSPNDSLGHNAIGVDYAGNNNTWLSVPSGMGFKFYNGSQNILTISSSSINYNSSFVADSNGNITTGSWSGTTISVNKGGTGRTSYSNGQLLIGSGTSLATNTLTGGSGIIITNGSGAIIINTSGLQTALTNPVTGTGVANHIPYWSSTSGLLADSNQLVWDATNNRLGIGTASPGVALDVRGAVVFNEDGADADFRVEGDTDANLLFVDASTDRVGIGTATPGYKLQVNGSLGATTKSFRIDHPSKSGWNLEYGSLESPYHGVRLTGRDKVIKGIGTVDLPNYLKDLIHDDESIVIQLTNYKHGKTLYVDKIDLQNDKFIVKADRAKTLGELEFFWTLTGTRKDVENLVVEKEN